MSYENAPATKMLATHCCLCARPLVDAVSVEAGMGPDCRENSGYYAEGASADARSTVNAIVYRIAAGMDLAELPAAIETVRSYGFHKLADTLAKRLSTITVEDRGDGTIAVFTPYSPEFVPAVKAAAGGWAQFDRQLKAWIVPNGPKVTKALWAAMRRCFPGVLGVGPKGLFTTPAV
jgi:hypothetical protein